MSQGNTQVLLRLPEWLHKRIADRAQATGRSISAEVRDALVRSYGERDEHPETWRGTDRRRGEP